MGGRRNSETGGRAPSVRVNARACSAEVPAGLQRGDGLLRRQAYLGFRPFSSMSVYCSHKLKRTQVNVTNVNIPPLCGASCPLLQGQPGSGDRRDTYSQSVRPAAPVPRRSCRGRTQLGRRHACQPGRPSAWREEAGPEGSPGPPPASTLTVAVWEAREARSTRLAPLPREVGPAVAAAGQVLTRPVGEV